MSYRDEQVDLTDSGAADALVAAARTDWRYVHDTGVWLRWGGTVWRPDKRLGIVGEARAVVEELRAAVDTVSPAAAWKKALTAWTSRQSAHALEAQIRLARADPALALISDQLDAHPMLLATPSGVVDLATGRQRPADRALLMTRETRAPFDPAASSDVWEQFIGDCTCGDSELAAWLRQAVGMSLIGDQREQVAIFCHGLGANGKTTFLDAICYALGDYAAKAAPDIVTASKNDRHPTEIMDLAATRMVVIDEFRGASAIDESKLKRLTGGGRTKARAMGKDYVEFPNTWQLWLDGNSQPRVYGQDEGIWRRLQLVPWRHHVEPDARDRSLPDRLREAAPAILRWALDGCREYLAAGALPKCDAVTVGTRAYRLEQDMVGAWLADTYALDAWKPTPGAAAWTPSALVITSSRTWAEANNVRPWTPTQLAQELRMRGCAAEKRMGVRGWLGLDPAAFTPRASGSWPERSGQWPH